MRLITSVLALLLGAAFTAHAQTKKMDGTWIPIKQEIVGTTLPPAAMEKQKLIIKDTAYTMMAESVDMGIVKVKDGKMDIYGRDGVNAGKHFMAIYKYENDLLTICYNLAGDSYPEAYETKGKPAFFISTFKKEGGNK